MPPPKLQGDYLIDNLLAQIKKMERRLGALERRGQNATTGDLTTTGAAPDGVLPAAGSIPPLYLVERTSGDLYELICETKGGRARLLLQRVGPLRSEGG